MVKQILFSGHMIDSSDRKLPRFPAELVNNFEKRLGQTLINMLKDNKLNGISSAAAGGDIIFHELCISLGIPTEIYLPNAPEEFRKESVHFAGKDWSERFDKLLSVLPVHILADREKTSDNIYTKTNTWMLEETIKFGRKNACLIALWNGKQGDGGGGTWEMVASCRSLGIEEIIIHPE